MVVGNNSYNMSGCWWLVITPALSHWSVVRSWIPSQPQSAGTSKLILIRVITIILFFIFWFSSSAAAVDVCHRFLAGSSRETLETRQIEKSHGNKSCRQRHSLNLARRNSQRKSTEEFEEFQRKLYWRVLMVGLLVGSNIYATRLLIEISEFMLTQMERPCLTATVYLQYLSIDWMQLISALWPGSLSALLTSIWSSCSLDNACTELHYTALCWNFHSWIVDANTRRERYRLARA